MIADLISEETHSDILFRYMHFFNAFGFTRNFYQITQLCFSYVSGAETGNDWLSDSDQRCREQISVPSLDSLFWRCFKLGISCSPFVSY